MKLKLFSTESKLEKIFIIMYFLFGLIEVAIEVFEVVSFKFQIRIIVAVIIGGLYWFSSKIKNPLFFISLLLLLISRLCIVPTGSGLLLYALIAVFFHRIIIIYYISNLLEIKDFIPVVLASLPFLIFFLYLVSIPENVLILSYVVLIVHIILISLLSGIVLSQYMLTIDKMNIWLCIYGLMSLMQTFIIFIEKFYLSEFEINVLRPSALFLNTIICIAFYKFVIATEKAKQE